MSESTTKPAAIVFYSWQSDLPNRTNRGFIQTCLEQAIKELGRSGELQVDPSIDRDTTDVPGTPHIPQTILDKIDGCDLFVGDVSLVANYTRSDGATRSTPNPNVLVELGYAVKNLTWDRVLIVANIAFGELKEMPFDLEKRRIIPYQLTSDAADKSTAKLQLVGQLKDKISTSLDSHVAKLSPSLEVFFCDPDSEEEFGPSMPIASIVTDGLDRSAIPDYNEPPRGVYIGGTWMNMPTMPTLKKPNPNFHRDCFDWYVLQTQTKPIRIGIRNTGRAMITGVKLQFARAEDASVVVKEHHEGQPSKTWEPPLNFGLNSFRQIPGAVEIKPKLVEIDFGKLQVGPTVVSRRFRLGAIESGKLPLVGKIFSDQFSPTNCTLILDSKVNRRELTNEGLIDLFEDMERQHQEATESDDDDE